MTQRTTSAHTPLRRFWLRSRSVRFAQSLVVQSLSGLGVFSLLSSNLVLAQTSPSPDAVVTQEWVRQTGLGGIVQGGVVIPTGITSKPAAIWESKDNAAAVVTTERSTVLGWHWGVEVAPNSKEPIANLQAIALHQELENLIGRFESAQLAANATNDKGTEQPSRDATEVASTGSRLAGLPEPVAKAVAEAREIIKALPQLIDQQDYAAARRQWLKACSMKLSAAIRWMVCNWTIFAIPSKTPALSAPTAMARQRANSFSN